jgi:1-acyl-sn-glycerol-3-phosphate acyltransferase
LWVALNLIVATVPLSLIVLAAALLGVRGAIYDDIARLWCRWVLWASGVRVRIDGYDNLRADRAQIIVSNHESWYDVFAIAASMPGVFKFVAKKELAAIPFFGWAWRAAGHISIDRSDTQSAVRSLERAGEVMRRERAKVVIFAEGTRSPTPEMLPFKKGAFMLALHTGVEIVPTGVRGGRTILRKGDWRIRAGTLTLSFGEPVLMSGYSVETRDELVAHVRARVEGLRSGEDRAQRAANDRVATP